MEGNDCILQMLGGADPGGPGEVVDPGGVDPGEVVDPGWDADPGGDVDPGGDADPGADADHDRDDGPFVPGDDEYSGENNCLEPALRLDRTFWILIAISDNTKKFEFQFSTQWDRLIDWKISGTNVKWEPVIS